MQPSRSHLGATSFAFYLLEAAPDRRIGDRTAANDGLNFRLTQNGINPLVLTGEGCNMTTEIPPSQIQSIITSLIPCRTLREFDHTLDREVRRILGGARTVFCLFLYTERERTLCPVSLHLHDSNSPFFEIGELPYPGSLHEFAVTSGRAILIDTLDGRPWTEASVLDGSPYADARVLVAPLSLPHATGPFHTTTLGVMTLFNSNPNPPWAQRERLFVESLGLYAAPVLQSVLATEDFHTLISITASTLIGSTTIDSLMAATRDILRNVLRHDITILVQFVQETQGPWFALRFLDGITVDLDQIRTIPFERMSPAEMAATRKPIMFLGHDYLHHGRFPERTYFESIGIKSAILCPILVQGAPYGFLVFGSRRRNAFSFRDLNLAEQVGYTLSQAIDNIHAYEQVSALKEQLAQENIVLRQEIGALTGTGNIIGASPATHLILRTIEQLAPTDSVVLLQGETGTGKSLVAKAIHQQSPRSEKPFITINCAELSPTLIESELFGHEKGAFTGALKQKIGRLELAQGGTVFLDEVGEIPLPLQVKLLRVLDSQEFERVGGTQTFSLDIRIIAATNIDLVQAVNAGTFRRDLYYRLKVCPITIPPLRDRREDIAPLAQHFVRKYATRYRKSITKMRRAALMALTAMDWPGNIRELEHVIERAVILAQGSALTLDDLRPPLLDLQPASRPKTLADVERHHILDTLRRTNWILAGPQGAAAQLGLKRSTLQHRMKRLGIIKPT